jgi:hypothetical protein
VSLRARRVLRHGDGYTDPLLRRSQIGHSSFFDRDLLGSTHSVASPLRLLHQVHTRLLRSRATSKTSSRGYTDPLLRRSQIGHSSFFDRERSRWRGSRFRRRRKLLHAARSLIVVDVETDSPATATALGQRTSYGR